MPTDAELLRAYAAEKSEAAFGELVRRHVNLVYPIALRQCGGDAHLAEDVAQRVFTDLARKARQLSSHAVIGGWLYRSTQFAASDVVRAERRRRAREQEASAMHETFSSPSNSATGSDADWQKLTPVLDQAIGELAATDRDAVVLRFFEGRPFAEIGATLRLTDDAARMRVDRALDKLRAALTRRGITSTTAALGIALANQAAAIAPAGVAASVTGTVLTGASMSTGGGVLVAAFTFMNTAKIAVGLAGIVAVLAVGFGVRQQTRLIDATATLAGVTQQRDELLARVRALERTTTALSAPARTPDAGSVLAAKIIAPLPDQSGGGIDAVAEAALDKFVAGNPELQRLYVRQQTIRLRSRYGPFYRSQGLAPAQIERFEKVMSDYAASSVDVPAVAMAQGLEKSDPTVASLLRQADEEKTRALRDLLGAEGVEQLRAYERTRSVRDIANNLASELFYTDAPLTARQADQLTLIADASRGEGRGPVNWDFVVNEAQAQGVLSPSQIAVLAEKKEQIDLGARVYALMQPWRSTLPVNGSK